MLSLAIPIPSTPGQQEIEIDMKIGGRQHKIHYRVELYQWDDCQMGPEQRVECVRQVVDDYAQGWEIYDIGMPTDNYVPLTFIKREDWVMQRQLMREAL